MIYQGLESHSLFFIVTENNTTNFVIKKTRRMRGTIMIYLFQVYETLVKTREKTREKNKVEFE